MSRRPGRRLHWPRDFAVGTVCGAQGQFYYAPTPEAVNCRACKRTAAWRDAVASGDAA